jgi:TolB protein
MQRQVKWIMGVIMLFASVTLLASQEPSGQFELVPKIAFTSTRQNPQCIPLLAGEIFLMNLDGTSVQRVTDNGGCTHADSMANLSPDGKKIVFDSNRLTTNTGLFNISDLFLMDPDGTEQTLLTRGSSASWAPDGKNIAFHASASYYTSGGLITLPPIRTDPGAPTPDSDIFVANADDLMSGVAIPTNITNSPEMIEEDADWSPDGTKIVFTRDPVSDGVPSNPGIDYPAKEIYVMNADGTGLTRLTFDSYEERAPAWSPDGEHIVFMARIGTRGANIGQKFEICIMNADGTNLVRLTDNALFDATPTWSPDGQKIVFHRTNPPIEIWTVDADTICDGTGTCTCSANLVGGSCETQLTTGSLNLLPHAGQLRVHMPKT